MNTQNKAARALALLVLLHLSGCATTAPERSVELSSPSAPPAWIQGGSGVFKSPKPVVRGVGIATGIQSQALRKSMAAGNARSEAARFAQSIVGSIFKRYALPESSDEASQADEAAKRSCSEAVANLLKELPLGETWEAPGGSMTAVSFELPIDRLKSSLQQALSLHPQASPTYVRAVESSFAQFEADPPSPHAKD